MEGLLYVKWAASLGALSGGFQPEGHYPSERLNDAFAEVAYQRSCILDSYIMIHHNTTIMK